ncbi:MAG: sulfatase-like hydrolase/transferase [Planctomycetaceae bacterium]|nr:sulfatase-like hydrolase/transferase [Planctomycetaceae bacterium]
MILRNCIGRAQSNIPRRYSDLMIALFLLLVGTYGSAVESAEFEEAQVHKNRPNIVLILADDLGVEGLSCYGGTSYHTPRLDRMAAEGMRFTQAYAQPLCTNTRIQLMTGQYNHRNWVAFGILDPRLKTFGHLLQNAGYRTCMAGKWQLTSYDPPDYPGAELRRGKGMRIEKAGFDQYSVWHAEHTEDKGPRYADPVIYQNGEFRQDTGGKYGEDLWVEFISDFLGEQRKRSEPFFVYYSMTLPHWPFVPTPKSREWGIEEEMHPPLGTTGGNVKFFPDMVTYLDEKVGQVLDAIEKNGFADNTLILFYSDNGTDRRVISKTMFGVVEGGKGLTTRAGTHVPLIARWPGVIPVGLNQNLVDSTDFLPTLLEFAQAPVPTELRLDGISFAAQLRNLPATPREWVFCHFDPQPGWDKEKFARQRFVQDTSYKLYETGLLYQIEQDPLEQMPLPESADTSKVRQRLQEVLDQVGGNGVQ